jgi:hypothetical protein
MPISGEVYKQIGRSAVGAVSIVTAYDRNNGKIPGLTVSSFVTLLFTPLVICLIQQNADSYLAFSSSISHMTSRVKLSIPAWSLERTDAHVLLPLADVLFERKNVASSSHASSWMFSPKNVSAKLISQTTAVFPGRLRNTWALSLSSGPKPGL